MDFSSSINDRDKIFMELIFDGVGTREDGDKVRTGKYGSDETYICSQVFVLWLVEVVGSI